MTKWALRRKSELPGTRGSSILQVPQISLWKTIPARTSVLSHRCLPFLEPATQSSQPQLILSSSECNQEPPRIVTLQFLLGSPANASSSTAATEPPKWRDDHDQQRMSSFRSSCTHPSLSFTCLERFTSTLHGEDYYCSANVWLE